MWLNVSEGASATLLALDLAVCGITVTLELRRPDPFLRSTSLLIAVCWNWYGRASVGAETALVALALATLSNKGLLSLLRASVPKVFFSTRLVVGLGAMADCLIVETLPATL